MVKLITFTEPSPNRALKPAVWAEPNPGSQYQSAPLALLVQLIRGHWLSGITGTQLPASRMFGQSELCVQPGSSHQSQTRAWYWRLETAFSATASVFDRPSGTVAAVT